MATKQCTGCGAIAEIPERGFSTRCAYCDSSLVDSTEASKHIDRVAPFRIKRSVAEQKLKEHLAGKFWAPNEIKKGIVEEHKLRGVLIPFWAYHGLARSEFSAKVGIYWYKTVTYIDSKGKVRTKKKRMTEWFSHRGTAIRPVEGHLASASVGLPEADSNELEPFDLGRAEPFHSRWVAGWEAEIPSIGNAQGEQVLRHEVGQLEAARVESHLLPGDEGDVVQLSTDVEIERSEVVLLPVWVASWRHGDKVVRQMVNGQTGKVIGEIPNSPVKIAIAVSLWLLAAVGMYFWVSS